MSLFAFNRAIVRTPARSVTDGLRAGDHAGPGYEAVAAEHDAYVAALKAAGLAVDVLPALDEFPDSVFVEDPALVFGEGAILLRPGAPTRSGEVVEMRAALSERFDRVLELSEGYADGGDILVTPHEVLIGLSARTDAVGAAALAACIEQLGHRARVVETPAGVLHFKTACAMLDEETVVVTTALDDEHFFGSLRRLRVAEGEEAAANLLRLNDRVLVGAAFPETRAQIEAHGLEVVSLDVSEIAKIDAGLSCMSLRWQA